MVQLLQHRTWMLYVHTLLLCVTTCVQVFAQSTGDSTVKPASPRSFSLGAGYIHNVSSGATTLAAGGTNPRETMNELLMKFPAPQQSSSLSCLGSLSDCRLIFIERTRMTGRKRETVTVLQNQ